MNMIKLPLLLVARYWIALSALLLAIITLLSLWPLSNLPSVPGGDKSHHFIAYGALMFPTALVRPRHWPLIMLFFSVWSGGIELIQPYANRYAEWLDLVANVLGLCTGLLLATALRFLCWEKSD